MKIYTKTGDDGTTGLFGGTRVSKHDPRVQAYGTVDETNAVIGLARSLGVPSDVDEVLEATQADLFVLGAELATKAGHESRLPMRRLDGDDVARLERAIDAAEEGLPALANFVLPGGRPEASALHQARTVARRAEREVLLLRDTGPAEGIGAVRDELVHYLNRLSDLLFVLARRANHVAGVADVPWKPRA